MNLLWFDKEGNYYSTQRKPCMCLHPKAIEIQRFMKAIYNGDIEFVRTYIDQIQDINAFESDDSPLILAVDNNEFEIVDLLIEKGADINAQTKAGWSALHIAIDSAKDSFEQNENTEPDTKMIEHLLKYHPNVELKNNFGKTPLDMVKGWTVTNWVKIRELIETESAWQASQNTFKDKS